MSVTASLGEMFKLARKDAGLTFAAVAADPDGPSTSTLVAIEGGERIPSPALARRLAKKYGRNPDEFVNACAEAAVARVRHRFDVAAEEDVRAAVAY